MTLTELALKYKQGEADLETIKKEIKKINIFMPILGEDESDDSIFSIGDGNSWVEVTHLITTGDLSEQEYRDFFSAVYK